LLLLSCGGFHDEAIQQADSAANIMYALDDESDARLIRAHFDAPAFARRARDVQGAWDTILGICARQRNEWLAIPKIRLAAVFALAGDWPAVGQLLANSEGERELERLHALWKPRLRVPMERSTSRGKLRSAYNQLAASCDRFNRRWRRFLDGVDLTGLNERRAAYNRYYVLEKECALRSSALARQGFQPLPAATTDDLFREFPLILLPRLREDKIA